MLGYTDVEIEPHADTWKRLLHPDDLPRAMQLVQDVLSGKRDYVMEFRMRHKDGRYVEILSRGFPVRREPGGPVVRIVGTHLDLTERKQAENALRESEEQNRLLFEESPVALILLDARSVILRANRAYQELTGFSAEQMVGHAARELALLPPESYDRMRDLLRLSREMGDPSVFVEHQLVGADGVQFEVSSRIIPIRLGGSEHILVTTIDVSAYKRAEELLRQANVEMEQAMHLKDDFLANMSHELRTPLTGILGLSESMLLEVGGPITERQRKYLSNIDASGRHLLSLVNDILDLSKIEAGKIELELENLFAADICQASLVFVKEPAIRKHIEVLYQSAPAIIPMVADARRLKQILVNLLSNAVKFTPDNGQVQLHVRADHENALISFEVIDTGIGISAQDLERLFKPFIQLDSSLSRQYEGTGLGLALVKKLAAMHGGQVQVESEPGKGSCFRVILPLRLSLELSAGPAAPAPAPQAVLAAFAKPNGKRILLADDNEANAAVPRDFLAAQGYEVFSAPDGAAALALASQCRPDLILMDIQMPGMNGLEAIWQLRNNPEFKETPIVALTALAMPGDRERCLEAGADEYMSKPLSLRGLLRMIETLLGKRQ